MRCAAYRRRRTAAGHQKLVRVADVIDRFRLGDGKIVKVQTDLADVRMNFLHGQLTAAGAVVRIRVARIHKIGAVVARDAAA